MTLAGDRLVVSVRVALGAVALGAVACSSSSGVPSPPEVAAPAWTADALPSANAMIEPNACSALAACCAADAAGDLYCAASSPCNDAFQYELNYGYCADFTYSGFAVVSLAEPGHSQGESDGDDAGDAGDVAGGDDADDHGTPAGDGGELGDGGEG